MIRLSTFEGRQKRVVDVDHFRKASQKVGAQHLHVLGQNGQFNSMLHQQLENLLFGLRLAIPVNGHMHERHLEHTAETLQIRMIGDDQWHLHRQLTALNPPEKVL